MNLQELILKMPGTDMELAQSTKNFEDLKNQESVWRLCISGLTENSFHLNEFRINFGLQLLLEHARTQYKNTSLEDQIVLRQFLLEFPTTESASWIRDSSLRNKFAQIQAVVFMKDYPAAAPDIFNRHFRKLDNLVVANYYLRFLIAVDAELSDLQHLKSADELHKIALIKDLMRDNDIADIVYAWETVMNMFGELRDMSKLVFSCIGRYAKWIDINWIYNENVVSILCKFFKDESMTDVAAEAIQGIVSKKVEPKLRTTIIESFFFHMMDDNMWTSIIGSNPDYGEIDRSIGELLNTMGLGLIDSYEKLMKERDVVSSQITLKAINAKIVYVIHYLMKCSDENCLIVVEFLREYLHLMKIKEVYESGEGEILSHILDTIVKRLRYPTWYNFEDEDEREGFFQEFRKSLKVLLDNLVALDQSSVFKYVRNYFAKTSRSWMCVEFQDLEVALSLFYFIGESGCAGSSANNFTADLEKASEIQHIMLQLVNSDLFKQGHRIVVLQFFENVVRYEKFFHLYVDQTAKMLGIFLKEFGLLHPDKKVRSRCAYLFLRFIKGIKNQLTPEITAEIVTAIQPLLVLVPAPPKNVPDERLLTEGDQLYLYEVVGVLIITGPQLTRATYMRQVIEPLLESCSRVREELFAESNDERKLDLANVIVQAVAATGRLSKAFSTQQSMKSSGCLEIFIQALKLFIDCFMYAKGESKVALQNAVRQYMHRLIVCMDEEILPFIPSASEQLLINCDARGVQEYIPLINQVIAKFKLSWVFQKEITPFLRLVFHPIVQRVFDALEIPFEANDLQAVRERQLLQRQYVSFIAALVTNDLTDVLEKEDAAFMKKIMDTIMLGAVDIPDPVVQRSCFTILKKFVEMYGGPTNPMGFMDFMYNQIMPACFIAPLKQHFDLTDAQTLLALNEIALCLKAILGKRMEEFVAHLRMYLGNTLELPNQKTEEFIGALQSPMKVFKPYLKGFFNEIKPLPHNHPLTPFLAA